MHQEHIIRSYRSENLLDLAKVLSKVAKAMWLIIAAGAVVGFCASVIGFIVVFVATGGKHGLPY